MFFSSLKHNGPAANELQDHLLSDCQKSLAEFAPAGAKKMEIIFSGGVYVGECSEPQPLSNESPVKRVSFESLSKILF